MIMMTEKKRIGTTWTRRVTALLALATLAVAIPASAVTVTVICNPSGGSDSIDILGAPGGPYIGVNTSVTISGLTAGGTFQVIARPGAGRAFLDWSTINGGSIAPTVTPGVFTVGTLDSFLYGNFGLPQIPLTMRGDGNQATMTPIVNSTTYYDEGSDANIATSPQGGYAFRFWGYETVTQAHANVANPLSESTTVAMDAATTVKAYFSPIHQLTMNAWSGPTVAPVYRDLSADSEYLAEVYSPIILDTATHRYICVGWTGTGDIPGTGNATSYGPYTVTQNSSMTWLWDDMWRLLITTSAGGTTTPGATTNHWYQDGETVSCIASAEAGYLFTGWYDSANTLIGQGTLQLTMTQAYTIQARFALIGGDSDNDGMSDTWESLSGLDQNDAAGVNGSQGDPDNDRLSNLQEFTVWSLTVSNSAYACDPLNADSDGDGMDDGYEYYHMLGVTPEGGGGDDEPLTTTDIVGDRQNAAAPVSRDSAYGQDGNLDQDFHWNTETGYESQQGLSNFEEYNGADGIVPGSWPATNVAGITETVYRYVANPADTGDQTYSDTTDSEIIGGEVIGDGFDDGFEYSWDRYQDVHGGDPVRDPLGHTIPYRFGNDALPLSAATADFNGDGELDVAVANSGLDQIAILYGQGGGVLAAPEQNLSVGSTPSCIVAADLMEDGTPNDLLVANSGESTISVIICLNDGTFNSAVPVGVGSNPSRLVTGMFDTNTTVDVAVANFGSDDVTILSGSGGGLFTQPGFSPIFLDAGATPSDIDAGPIWGATTNPVDDLVVAGFGTDRWYIIQNDGTGTFGVPSWVAAGSQPSCIRIGDFGGALTGRDGTNDVTVTTYGDNSVRSYFGNGAGAFVAPAAEAVFALGAGRGPVHFGMGDFDSETATGTHIDLAVANQDYTPGTVRMLVGAVSAAFAPGDTLVVGEAPSWVQVADMNDDGYDDLIIVERDGGTVSAWWGYGVNAQFTLAAQYDTSLVVVDRRFHPRVRHVDPADYGRRDYDLVYDPDSGGVSEWLTDDLEYVAWSNAVSPLLRTQFPTRRRCTNPFLWDTDGDNLPDGWEMAFALDPWDINTDNDDRNDDVENDDEDAFATGGGNKHHDVYLAEGYDPRTAWGYDPPKPPVNPNSGEFTNYEELIGPRGVPALVPNDPDDKATHPYMQDTDGDGIWDGWEWYVNLDARNPADAGKDDDPNVGHFQLPFPKGDGLSNFEEFDSYSTPPTNGVPHNGEWPNKSHPTDPWNQDTDNDQLADGGEKADFNFVTTNVVTIIDETTGEITYTLFHGGGLNPTSVDTDGDHIPDAWEVEFGGTIGAGGAISNGMDGTSGDNQEDTDGDGLLNYQEYMCGAVYHWQFQYNSGAPAWVTGLGLYGYEPYDFFDETLSGGEVFTGPGGRAPYHWDPNYMIGPIYHKIPWRFMTAAEHVSGLWFSTSDPQEPDTDLDDMDDFWETYHGLNPLFGTLDVVRSKVWGVPIVADWFDEFDFPVLTLPVDVRRYPWIAGHPMLDVDQDQLPNIFESIQPDVFTPPPYYHTDPSPLWSTDTSYEESWVNLFYWLGAYFGNPLDPYWYWDETVINLFDDPPSYMYSFEVNEGYETDNDNLPDHAELVDEPGVSPGVTDLLESQSPIKRRALHLNGNAAARSLSNLIHDPTDFRQFTVEVWTRPQNPTSGVDQIIVERPMTVPQGNTMGLPFGVRVNFRVGLDANGRPYAGYHGSGEDLIFVEATADSPAPLPADQWTHLAATYGGDFTASGYWEGELRLYVNGNLAAATPSSEIPVNGWFGGLEPDVVNYGFILSAPIIVGAGDMNPDGWPHKAPVYVGSKATVPFDAHTPPVLHSFFTGWLDQVHIWDGPRSQTEISASMYTRYSRADIHSRIVDYPGIRYAFSFDDLPDPDHSPIAPEGFAILNGRPLSYTGIPWWANADDRSLVYNDYRYLPWADNLAGHAADSPPLDSTKPWSTSNFYPNTSNPYTLAYGHAPYEDDEHHPDLDATLTSYGSEAEVTEEGLTNLTDEAGVYLDLLPLRWAEADEDVEMWDMGGLGTDPFDTDGDGLPDGWEEANGMDPRDSTGDEGSLTDPDADGLNTLAEYLAVTDPYAYDSQGTGYADFYLWSGMVYRIYGEIYTDFDGMEDEWELMSGLDPDQFDAHQDPDDDGFSNLDEFWASLTDWASCSVALPGDTNNYFDPGDGASFPFSSVSMTFNYEGDLNDGPIAVKAHDNSARDGVPRVRFEYPSPDADITEIPDHFPHQTPAYTGSIDLERNSTNSYHPGDWWFFCFFDNDDDKSWDPGEPAGVGEGEPASLALFGPVNIKVGLTDWLPGYGRFRWTDVAGVNEYQISVSRNGIALFNPLRTVRYRTYFHEGDFHDAGFLAGLPGGTYTWKAYYDDNGTQTQVPDEGDTFGSGTFLVENPLPLGVPVPVWPVGAQVAYSREEFRWSMDEGAAGFQLLVSDQANLSSPLFDSGVQPAPFRETDGTYRWTVPFYEGIGGPPDGVYYWGVQALGGGSSSATYSSGGSFTLDRTDGAQGPFSVSGDVGYFGKVTNGVFIVESYDNPFAAGEPLARVALTNTVNTNEWPKNEISFEMRGLEAGDHYLWAFLDQNTNQTRDVWETYGFSRFCAYVPYPVAVSPSVTGVKIPMTLTDIDNDKIADDWEYQYTGNLGTMGPGAFNGYTDQTPGGLNDYESYAETPLNISPYDTSAAGADGIPYWIKLAFDLSPWEYYAFTVTTVGIDASGANVVRWSVPVGTPVQLLENGTAQIQNNGVTLSYRLQYSENLLTWTDLSGDAPVSYDPLSGAFEVRDASNTSRVGFYRVLMSFAQ